MQCRPLYPSHTMYFVNLMMFSIYLTQFVATMSASADVLALASAEFDIGGIAEGTTLTVKWRGKPVFIRHRTADEIAKEATVAMSSLKDPQSDADRVKEAEWLVNVVKYSCCLFDIRFACSLRLLTPLCAFMRVNKFCAGNLMCCVRFVLTFAQADCAGYLHTSRLRAHLRRR